MLSLKGQFLVAMPEMGDERFRDSVIYLVGHGDEGAMGLVVNQSLEDMRFGDILEELQLGEQQDIIRLPQRIRERRVLRGGPVQRGRRSPGRACLRRACRKRAHPAPHSSRSTSAIASGSSEPARGPTPTG